MDWLYEAVSRCDADTYMAYCFRSLVGIERRPRAEVKAKRPSEAYEGIEECFGNRRRVNL